MEPCERKEKNNRSTKCTEPSTHFDVVSGELRLTGWKE